MVTREALRKVNEEMKTIPLKGKQYAMVKDRVHAFREIEPSGSITTEILHFDDEKVVMKTTISDENGLILATGIASEKFNSSQITATSAFEVCETSSVGRALGFLDIGIDESMASADELTTAIKQQNELATDIEKKTFVDVCKHHGFEPTEILESIGWKKGDLTREQHGKALLKIVELTKGKE